MKVEAREILAAVEAWLVATKKIRDPDAIHSMVVEWPDVGEPDSLFIEVEVEQ